MNRAERRKLKELKFKKRLKFWANLKYPVKENSEWRAAKSWTELRNHHEFRDSLLDINAMIKNTIRSG